jgi:hypothetical protein
MIFAASLSTKGVTVVSKCGCSNIMLLSLIMTAQPASQRNWNGSYRFGKDVLIDMPEYGSYVAAVIAGWSLIEAQLGRTFAALIGAKQPVTMSMYSAVRSFDVQKSLLEAAVDDRLPKRNALFFRAALTVINRAAIHRHRFAHWIWGASADPALTGLLLVEPKNFWNVTAAQIKYWNKKGKAQLEAGSRMAFQVGLPRLAHEHIYVYELKDLKDCRKQVERALYIADELRNFANSRSKKRREIYRLLTADDEICTALKKAKTEKAKKTPRTNTA